MRDNGDIDDAHGDLEYLASSFFLYWLHKHQHLKFQENRTII